MREVPGLVSTIMNLGPVIISVFVVMALSAGCVSAVHNPHITVRSTDIDTLSPINMGTIDVYTADFRIANPTNETFRNVRIRINITPETTFCHAQYADLDIPVMNPQEKRTERVSFSEISNLDCVYSYTYDVVSDR